MQNKTKANLTLAASAAMAIGTLPAINPGGGFFLGLLNHGFIAATIGGMADWFAVNALFHKPLGISYRTEILKRNRKRITDALIEFVGEDLLNTKNIMETVREENTAQLLIEFFEQYDGRVKTKILAHEILSEIIASIDSEKMSQELSPIVESEIKKFDAQKIIDAAVKIITDEKHSRNILTALLETGQKILKSKHMQDAIYKKIVELRETYEGDSAGRALVLSSMNLTDEKILSILNENAEDKISATISALNAKGILSAEKIKTAQDLIDSFERAIKNAVADIDAEKFQREFGSLFGEKISVADYMQKWLETSVKGTAENPILNAAVDRLIDDKIDAFIKSDDLQAKFDALVKNIVENMLEEYHGEIPALIRERLDKFSDDELTEFVETRVADDLQMIRINGSVCGALVGMALYIVAQIIGQIG